MPALKDVWIDDNDADDSMGEDRLFIQALMLLNVLITINCAPVITWLM